MAIAHHVMHTATTCPGRTSRLSCGAGEKGGRDGGSTSASQMRRLCRLVSQVLCARLLRIKATRSALRCEYLNASLGD